MPNHAYLISQQDKHLLQDAVSLCRNILSKYDLDGIPPIQPELRERYAGLLGTNAKFTELEHIIKGLPVGRRI